MASSQQKFGSAHTSKKLAALEAYLEAYTTALKNQPFQKIYFDAFAGSGAIDIGNEMLPLLTATDLQEFIDGSARRALRFGTLFDRYIFVDARRKNVLHLHELIEQHPEIADRVSIIHNDANEELQKFCAANTRRNWRAVVFLDPYGNNVAWDTVASLAQTESVDLWYLFPAGLGVNRQIKKDGSVHYTHELSLDRLFGTWRTEFLSEESTPDLFVLPSPGASRLLHPTL